MFSVNKSRALLPRIFFAANKKCDDNMVVNKILIAKKKKIPTNPIIPDESLDKKSLEYTICLYHAKLRMVPCIKLSRMSGAIFCKIHFGVNVENHVGCKKHVFLFDTYYYWLWMSDIMMGYTSIFNICNSWSINQNDLEQVLSTYKYFSFYERSLVTHKSISNRSVKLTITLI